jgi:gas vesicle protein
MDLKDQLKKAADGIKTVAEDVKDKVNEAAHRSTAEAEQTRRDAAGETMTTSEKAGSVINQAKNTAQAEIDAAKQEARRTP